MFEPHYGAEAEQSKPQECWELLFALFSVNPKSQPEGSQVKTTFRSASFGSQKVLPILNALSTWNAGNRY